MIVSELLQPDKQQPTAPVTIGARVMMDILRYETQCTHDAVQLTPARNKSAQFVLEKTLAKFAQREASRTYPFIQMDLESALVQYIQAEGRILYMAEMDWGMIRLLDQVFLDIAAKGKLDEESLWLLNRFRLPMLFGCLADLSFFFSRQNVARRFLNLVTLYLLTTKEPFARDLRFVLGGLATRMHEALVVGPGKLNALCLEGQAWFATHLQRLRQAQEKVKEVLETRERRGFAEERVVTLVNHCIAEKKLPQILVEFILGDWRQLLLHTSMREGEQGVDWKRQSRLTESMVAFVNDCQTPEGRTQYQKFLPSLLKGVQTSLAQLTEDPQLVVAKMEPLELVLNAVLLGAAPDVAVHPGLPVVVPPVQTFELTLENSPAIERIRGLGVGEWVRFVTREQRFEACMLVVKGTDSSMWSFVNQSGQAVVSKTLAQLGALLNTGVLEIVGEGNAVDDALNRILPRLAEKALAITAEKKSAAPPLSPWRESLNSAKVKPSLPEAKNAESLEASEIVATEIVATERETVTVELDGDTNTNTKDAPDEGVCKVPGEFEDALTEKLAEEPELTEDVQEAAYNLVDGLQVGARLIWYKTAVEDVSLKLAVKIRSTGKLVFVNHVGIKLLELDRPALARKIALGSIAIIDMGAKFDSTLERIVKHIQQDKK
ncbi:Hypothetical protein HDN1F_33660 [gamma proteobacterium HdN1]|nr:Hypothetical protein HDN1F_33660 [gamma proteobacterium HdN1]